MRLPTASSWNRVASCPASSALPAVKREAGDAARVGTEIHAFLASVTGHQENPEAMIAATVTDPETAQRCRDIDLMDLPLGIAYTPEVTFAYDPFTDKSRVLGENLDRNYPDVSETEIIGTADVVSPGNPAYVADYKTGRVPVPHPGSNWQMKLGAVALSRFQDAATVAAEIIYIGQEGEVRKQSHVFGPFDLDEIALEAREIVEQIRQAREDVKAGRAPTVSEGDHCKYCPAFTSCPAKVSMLRATATSPEALHAGAITPSVAAESYQAWRRAKEVVDHWGRALKAYAQESPIELDSGKSYGPRESARSKLDGDITYQVLKELYGEDVALAGVGLDASKASIKRAIRTVDDGETLKSREEKVIDAVRAAGGIVEKTTTRFEER